MLCHRRPWGCVSSYTLAKRLHKYAHRKHANTHRISVISTQLFCILSCPVKNAISGVVNMKNKHTHKSLPPVNYLRPDCIWPFTPLSVANYNPSLWIWSNLGIGTSKATSWIQIKQHKTLRPLLCNLIACCHFSHLTILGVVHYLVMCKQAVNFMTMVLYSHQMAILLSSSVKIGYCEQCLTCFWDLFRIFIY